MGNALTAPSAALPAPADVLADLPVGLVVKSSLGGGRFLKTARTAACLVRASRASHACLSPQVLCAHNDSGSLVVVKVFLVRGEVRRRDVDAALALLAQQTAALAQPPLPSPHVAPAARVHRTERAIFLMRCATRLAGHADAPLTCDPCLHATRQHVHTTLKERMASAVPLAPTEKLFIAYQARVPRARLARTCPHTLTHPLRLSAAARAEPMSRARRCARRHHAQ